jgi:hypothetical protein
MSSKGDVSMQNFRFVMAQILTSFEPLTCNSLNKLIEASEAAPRDCSAEKVLDHLGSLLSGVDNKDTAIRPLHNSFRDFLTDNQRSQDFCISTSGIDTHSSLICASLTIMFKELRFNICELNSSYFPNKDIPGIEEKIKKHIPHHLSYACRFWAAHLSALPAIKSAPQSNSRLDHWNKLISRVHAMLRTHLLYWLEVLSLLGAVDSGLRQIREVYAWIRVSNQHPSLAKMT